MESLQKTDALSSALEAKTGQLAAATEDLEVVVVLVAVTTAVAVAAVVGIATVVVLEGISVRTIIMNSRGRGRGRELRWFHKHVAHVYAFIGERLQFRRYSRRSSFITNQVSAHVSRLEHLPHT